MPGYFDMPTGVAFTSPSALPIAVLSSVATDGGGLGCAKHINQAGRLPGIDVEDRKMADAQIDQRPCDSHARPARAEKDDSVKSRSLHPPVEALGKTPAIGVVPDCTFGSEDNRVDRADCPGVRRQQVEVCDDALFKRMRDIRARVAVGLQPRHQARKFASREARAGRSRRDGYWYWRPSRAPSVSCIRGDRNS